ncbi:MAG: C25 family cysteine peptidase, partial [Gemmatimonadaceae bacterium]|nr:C25 family cysteine peptidase [Gemmatimonadaceae bacterium]
VDPDAIVYSDNPYGATGDTLDEYLAPALPVGRIADSATGDAQGFVDLIEEVGKNRSERPALSGATSVVNREWSATSAHIARFLASPVLQREAPDYELDDLHKSDTTRRHLYFNLHGFLDDRTWKGFDPIRGQFFTVATPNSFDREHAAGAIVFIENCYGALTVRKDATTSCALRLLQQGCAAVIGATGLAFGSHMHPNFLLENADHLARLFFESLAGGLSVGGALVRARQVYKSDASIPATNVFKRKTLLQFTLLGDPAFT